MDIIIIVGVTVVICVISGILVGEKSQIICICFVIGLTGGLIVAALNQCYKQLEIIIKLLGG